MIEFMMPFLNGGDEISSINMKNIYDVVVREKQTVSGTAQFKLYLKFFKWKIEGSTPKFFELGWKSDFSLFLKFL